MTSPYARTLPLLGIAFVLVVAGVVGATGAAGATVAEPVTGAATVPDVQEGNATVTVADSTVATDDASTTTITLDAAPDGLQRYNVTVAVDDPSVASIDAVEPGDVGAFQVRSQSETAITFRAADLGETVEPGASDVSLGAVTVAGSEQGTTELTATVHEIRGDDSAPRQPAVEAGTLTVTGEDGAAGGESPAGGAAESGPLDDAGATLPGPPIAWIGGGLAALAIAILAAALVVRRRRRARRQPGRL